MSHREALHSEGVSLLIKMQFHSFKKLLPIFHFKMIGNEGPALGGTIGPNGGGDSLFDGQREGEDAEETHPARSIPPGGRPEPTCPPHETLAIAGCAGWGGSALVPVDPPGPVVLRAEEMGTGGGILVSPPLVEGAHGIPGGENQNDPRSYARLLAGGEGEPRHGSRGFGDLILLGNVADFATPLQNFTPGTGAFPFVLAVPGMTEFFNPGFPSGQLDLVKWQQEPVSIRPQITDGPSGQVLPQILGDSSQNAVDFPNVSSCATSSNMPGNQHFSFALQPAENAVSDLSPIPDPLAFNSNSNSLACGEEGGSSDAQGMARCPDQNQPIVFADYSMTERQQETSAGGVSLVDDQFLELVQLGYPPELFWGPSGERHTPGEIQSRVEAWMQEVGQVGGGGLLEDPNGVSPHHSATRPREILPQQSPDNSPEKKRPRQGEAQAMDTSESAGPRPVEIVDLSGAGFAYDESESWEDEEGEAAEDEKKHFPGIAAPWEAILARLDSIDDRVSSLETAPQHVVTSIDEARKQAGDYLIQQAAGLVEDMSNRVNAILQQGQQKFENHFGDLFAQQQEQIKNLFERGSGGVHARIDALQAEIQNILGAVQAQDSARKVLESALQDVCKGVNTQIFGISHQLQLLAQDTVKLNQQLQQVDQRQKSSVVDFDRKLMEGDLTLKRAHHELAEKISNGQKFTAREMQDLEVAMRKIHLNLDSCNSQNAFLQNSVADVQRGVSSMMGQVTSQMQASEKHARILAGKVSEVEHAVKDRPMIQPTPQPVVVPVTVNVETGSILSNRQKLPETPIQPPSPEVGFSIEPLEAGLTPIVSCQLTPAASCGGGSTFEVRPLAVSGAGQAPVQEPIPVGGNAVTNILLRNLVAPKFDDRNPNWGNFVLAWNSYWERVSFGNHYSEVQKLGIFELCLSDVLVQELSVRKMKGEILGFTQVFAMLKARFAGDSGASARRSWHQIALPSSGRISQADWQEFWVKFSKARLLVGDASEEEAVRLLLNRLPEFANNWVVEHLCEMNRKHPWIRMSAIANLSDAVVMTTIQRLVGSAPKSVKSVGTGDYQLEMQSATDADKLLMLNGRTIEGHSKPLCLDRVEAKLTSDEINELVSWKLHVRERQRQSNSLKDFADPPRFQKGKYSARVLTLDEEEEDCKISREIIASKLETAKTAPKPATGKQQAKEKEKVSQPAPVSPTPPPAANQTWQPAPTVNHFGCFCCGGFDHRLRNCPYMPFNQWNGYGPGGKGYGLKGGHGKGMQRGEGQKGKGGKGKGKGQGSGGRGPNPGAQASSSALNPNHPQSASTQSNQQQ